MFGDGEALVVAPEYPRPTLLPLNQRPGVGEGVYTKFNEPGYPSVVAVNTGRGVLTKVGGVRGESGDQLIFKWLTMAALVA